MGHGVSYRFLWPENRDLDEEQFDEVENVFKNNICGQFKTKYLSENIDGTYLSSENIPLSLDSYPSITAFVDKYFEA